MPAAKPKRFGELVPIDLLKEFQSEARIIIDQQAPGVWVLPPEWIAAHGQDLVAFAEKNDMVIVAIPAKQLAR